MKQQSIILLFAVLTLFACKNNNDETTISDPTQTEQTTDSVTTSDNTTTDPEQPVYDYTQLVLNEIDPNDKWIEIYNNGDNEINLAGVKLYKDGSITNDSKIVWTAADTLVLPANSYLVIVSEKADDATTTDAALIFAAGISPKKSVKIVLVDPQGNELSRFTRGSNDEAATDGIIYDWGDGAMSSDKTHSFSRVPNGTGDWYYAVPTRGTANGESTGEISQEITGAA